MGTLRLTGGTLRSRSVRTPAGRAVRPTPARVKEALFSILADRLDNANVLDLFAGTGALGFEALSRGAASATFVESDFQAAGLIRRNSERLGASALVLTSSGLALPKSDPFDLIFADPPYAAGSGSAVVAAVTTAGWLAPGSWLSVETGRDDKIDSGDLVVEAMRDVGRARLTLLRRA